MSGMWNGKSVRIMLRARGSMHTRMSVRWPVESFFGAQVRGEFHGESSGAGSMIPRWSQSFILSVTWSVSR